MKSLLIAGILGLIFTEEPSYNFGGRFTRADNVSLLIDVRDGSYWVTFAHKNGKDSLVCAFSAKASVRNNALRIRGKQGKQAITMIIRATEHTNRMIVRGFRQGDQTKLMHFCDDGTALAGNYSRVFLKEQ